MSKPALGRGLGALLGGASVKSPAPPVADAAAQPAPPAPAGASIRKVPLDRIRPCPFQPRKEFTEEAIRELADSIREQGIVQPLIVRPRGDHFELIAGERRWRAARLAGLTEAPVVEREATDREVLELALIENLQRENLNPIEEAQGYSQLIEQFQLRQDDVAQRVGKSRTVVANALRLLKLPSLVQSAVRDGRLSVGHAKVILGLADFSGQQGIADRVLAEGLSVRQTEELVTRWQTPAPSKPGPTKNGAAAIPSRDPHVADLETRLRERLGTKVTVRYRQGKGSVEVKFFTEAELERILQIVGVSVD
jgi:ParB family chromosome partitioning protein